MRGKNKKPNETRGKVGRVKKMGLLGPTPWKNSDNLKLFLSHPEAKAAIRRAREFLQLPPDGLPEGKIEAWYIEAAARSDEMRKSQKFQRLKEQIRQEIAEKKLDHVMARKQLDLVYDELPENKLTSAVEYIIRLYGLPLNYADSLRTYIVANIISAPAQSFSVGSEYDLRNDTSRVTVTVYAKLTDADLKGIKFMINDVVGKYLPEFGPIKEIDKRLRTEEKWSGDRSRIVESTGKIYKVKAEEIAEQELGSKIKRSGVYESTRELNDLRKKRFRNLGNGS